MIATKKGNTLERIENTFIVKQTRLSYDEETKLCFAEEAYHSQLTVFVGISQQECNLMVYSWLQYFGDPELTSAGLIEVDELFSQAKLLEAHFPDMGEDVN
jgi:hypothetical protein